MENNEDLKKEHPAPEMKLNELEKPAERKDPDSGLTPTESISVLIQAVRIAQSRGVYTLEDAENISKAIRTFVKPAPKEIEK